jgi:hypothetical protein
MVTSTASIAGVVALVRAGKAQQHAVDRRDGPCLEDFAHDAAVGGFGFHLLRAQVDIDRAIHATGAVFLQLARQFGCVNSSVWPT